MGDNGVGLIEVGVFGVDDFNLGPAQLGRGVSVAGPRELAAMAAFLWGTEQAGARFAVLAQLRSVGLAAGFGSFLHLRSEKVDVCEVCVTMDRLK